MYVQPVDTDNGVGIARGRGTLGNWDNCHSIHNNI